jgi:hypothetical protein
MRRIAPPYGVDLLRITMVKTPPIRRRASFHLPSKNEMIRLTDAERAAFVKASQAVLDKHRKQLDPKLFAYLGA